MKLIRSFGRRGFSSAAALGLLLATVVPSILPMTVSAGQMTGRSMQLSDSSVSATAVEYTLKFTPTEDAGALVVDFCKDSPIAADSACTSVTGLSLSGIGSTPSGATSSGSTIRLTTDMDADDPQEIVFTGITNPSYESTGGSNGFYARIYTYTDATESTTEHVSATNVGDYLDAGGIAMSINKSVSVNATIRETLLFCASKTAPSTGCSATDAPTVNLGTGSPVALTNALSSSSVYTQVSTNAQAGVAVSMKINNTCGGLNRTSAAANTCEIAPAGSTGIASGSMANTGKVGMFVGAQASGGAAYTGTVTATPPYSTNDTYAMDDTAVTGVSGTYGDQIYSSSAPVADVNVPLTFGAAAAITTPAGNYTAQFDLIATGTF